MDTTADRCNRSSRSADALDPINATRIQHASLPRQHGYGPPRRTSRGGRDSVDHAPGGHDDVANAACGALIELTGGSTYTLDHVCGPDDPPMRLWGYQRVY